MKNKILFLCFGSLCFTVSFSQPDRWQQRVKYTMNIDMNVQTNRFKGSQKLEYSNNSPDTLTRVFYHLYFNAFQPNSMMDTRSRILGQTFFGNRQDWDPRVKDRILNLKPDEIGYHKILSLKMNGRPQLFVMQETILEVKLDKPILPRSKVVFEMEFESQVPLQVRRSGRDNPDTKVRYSMSQWYPKICEYDYEGWHPTPYVAREFYGVWGDFDVTINIDKTYLLGGTGYLQNADQIGFGYEKEGVKVPKPKTDKLSWHFIAPNVHDFMWAADPEFIHKIRMVRDSLVFHLLYKTGGRAAAKEWEDILDNAEKAFPFIEKSFGGYPYKQFSFIDGGDGGMEYPMATLLAGPGAWLHEWLHNWYYGMLGTNESEYAWMDEGFTEFATDRTEAFLKNDNSFAHSGNYDGYYSLVKSGREEPLTTHADHFNTNLAYGNAVYSKGCVFLSQLGYITGEENLKKILLEYYRLWRFKHPNANDFIRVAEKVSDMKLDWYREYWISSTKTIDYSIDSLWEEGGKTKVRIRRVGDIPMPIDFQLTFKDGSKELHYIPMYLMFGEKPAEDASISRKVYEPWRWTHPTYIIESSHKLGDISLGEIDPSQRLADIQRKDN
ncbi:MAG TPA: M1 family metallopeptidase, partial [Chitinophagaceae bacterium]|nr:M1 family metallopeptidase [Chitinophagaceae bacterium]